jgi:hypothetical protein
MALESLSAAELAKTPTLFASFCPSRARCEHAHVDFTSPSRRRGSLHKVSSFRRSLACTAGLLFPLLALPALAAQIMRHELPEVNEGDYLDAAAGGLRFWEAIGRVPGAADPALGGLRREAEVGEGAAACPVTNQPHHLAVADVEQVRSLRPEFA